MAIKFESLPVRALRRGRELAWDPAGIDFSEDRKDWKQLTALEQEFLLSEVFGFLVGERGVAHDLAPLQQALRHERGRMEEEMYLTQQMYEESNHVEFFERWLAEVLPGQLGEDVPFPRGNPSPFFKEILPQAMQRLNSDPSPNAQMHAAVIYHQIIEGVLAEVGYAIFYETLDARDVMPGLRQGVRYIQQDESRHIAFGTYLAQRLIAEDPSLEAVFDAEMEGIRDRTVNGSADYIALYEERGEAPFGLDKEKFRKMGSDLFERRVRAVKKMGHVEV